jgi:ACR3 family arsenite efflux pump ArsB
MSFRNNWTMKYFQTSFWLKKNKNKNNHITLHSLVFVWLFFICFCYQFSPESFCTNSHCSNGLGLLLFFLTIVSLTGKHEGQWIPFNYFKNISILSLFVTVLSVFSFKKKKKIHSPTHLLLFILQHVCQLLFYWK